MSYTQSVILRVNTPEVRRKFEELGYRTTIHAREEQDYAFLLSHHGYLFGTNKDKFKNFSVIDCGTNIELALALAALRDDTNWMQWFTDGEDFIRCPLDNFLDFDDNLLDFEERANSWWKATPEELIEHFGKEE